MITHDLLVLVGTVNYFGEFEYSSKGRNLISDPGGGLCPLEASVLAGFCPGEYLSLDIFVLGISV